MCCTIGASCAHSIRGGSVGLAATLRKSIVKSTSLLSGADIQKLILAKGWTIRDVARYWDVSRQRLYQVFKQDAPALLWVCAAQGLPEASPDLLTLAKSRTKEKPGHLRPGAKPASSLITQAAGFSVGDILMASDYIGEIADEGEEGVITEIRRAGTTGASSSGSIAARTGFRKRT